MDERVLIADLQSGHPPFVHVRLVAVGDVDGTPPAQAALVAMLEILQAVQVVQIPADGGVFAVYLEGIEGLMSPRITGGFKCRQRAVLESRQERAGVVNAYLFDFAGEV